MSFSLLGKSFMALLLLQKLGQVGFLLYLNYDELSTCALLNSNLTYMAEANKRKILFCHLGFHEQ